MCLQVVSVFLESICLWLKEYYFALAILTLLIIHLLFNNIHPCIFSGGTVNYRVGDFIFHSIRDSIKYYIQNIWYFISIVALYVIATSAYNILNSYGIVNIISSEYNDLTIVFGNYKIGIIYLIYAQIIFEIIYFIISEIACRLMTTNSQGKFFKLTMSFSRSFCTLIDSLSSFIFPLLMSAFMGVVYQAVCININYIKPLLLLICFIVVYSVFRSGHNLIHEALQDKINAYNLPKEKHVPLFCFLERCPFRKFK